MPERKSPEISSSETKKRKLAYENNFREMLRDKPEITRKALELMRQAVDSYNPESFEYVPGLVVRYDRDNNTWLMNEPGSEPVRDENGQAVLDENRMTIYRKFDEQPFYYGRAALLVPGEPIIDQETGMQITCLGRSNRDLPIGFRQLERRVEQTDFFKVDIDDSAFFVKNSTVTQNPGFDEFHATQQAREALADLDNVEVVDAVLGYQDERRSWYVASWKELEDAGFMVWYPVRPRDDYGKAIDRPDSEQMPHEKFEMIEKKLRAVGLDADLESNLFFNPKTGKFFLLDVTAEKLEGIGRPIRPNY